MGILQLLGLKKDKPVEQATRKTPKPQNVPVIRAVEPTTRQPYTGGTRWSHDEDSIVMGFYNMGVSHEAISEMLTMYGKERSAGAVAQRVCRLNKEMQEQ